MNLIHYSLSAQDRTQIDGRWHNQSAPLCGTGDGHWQGIHPDTWSGQSPPITCPRCIELKHLVAPRERNRVTWSSDSPIPKV